MSDPLPVPAASNTFERIKRVQPSGAEFWSARELARVLEYTDFRNFSAVIAKAREACATSGHAVANHFVDINEMVSIGSGAQRELEDWALSRYACYLVIQNADPGKPLVALGQTYFAVQTRRQEMADDEALKEDKTRLLLRAEMKKVRKTIHELGGTMPENLPPAESIKKVESREKKRLKAGQTKLLENGPKSGGTA
jgi:DNA-damage-inducible protein D